MNKIFKIVWNHATQTFNVVSELAKSHGKPASQSNQTGVVENRASKKFRLVSLVTALSIGLGFSSFSFAVNQAGTAQTNPTYVSSYKNPDNPNVNGSKGTAVAYGAGSSSSAGGAAFGDQAKASDAAVAVGIYAQATGATGVAVGVTSLAKGGSAIAIGRQSASLGKQAIAIGVASRGKADGSIALGSSSFAEGANSIAIGTSTANEYDGKNNTHAKLENAIAVGHNAKSEHANSVAIGSNSKTVTGKQVTGATKVGSYSYNNSDALKAQDTSHVFSVGSTGNLRQIQHVANGDISTTSTDAINGGQLYSALTTVGTELDNLKNTKADKSTAFSIKAAGTEARKWALSGNSDINFTATSDLSVSTDKNGKIEYGLSNAYKKSVTDAIGLKADKTYVDNQLKTKVDQTTFNTELGKKADTATVNAELAKKADTATVNNELAKKADATTVNNALAQKVDKTALTTELSKKANASDLANKADKSTAFTIKASGATAKTWNLGANNDINFTSGDNNLVASVANGNVQYKLNNKVDLGAEGSLSVGGIKADKTGIAMNDRVISGVKEVAPAAGGKFAATTGQVHAVNQNVSALTTRVGTLETKTQELATEQGKINQNVTALGTRVTTLEGKTTAL